MEYEQEATLTVTLTVKVKPELGISLADKEAQTKQNMIDQAAALNGQYDYGMKVTGEITSSLTGNHIVDLSKPDYTE